VAFWYWSPLLALRQLQAAAKSMDGPAFNERVDYPRLRESVKASIMGKTEAPAENDPGAMIGKAFGEALVGRLIDGLVQPDVVMRMMANGKLKQDNADQPDPEEDKKDWFAEREGMSTFVAFVGKKGDTKEQRMGLVMERSGFATWRLVGLRMPGKQGVSGQ
jgi:hypothetical protein